MRYVEKAGFDEIHFFGDKTFAGGNDYEIFIDRRVRGHTVTCPEDTERDCLALFFPQAFPDVKFESRGGAS